MEKPTFAHDCIYTAPGDDPASCIFEIVHSGRIWQVIALTSFNASHCLCRWAEWCTAVDERSWQSYSRRGILFVIRNCQTQQRWQLHVPSGEFRTSGGHDGDWQTFRRRHRGVLMALRRYWEAQPRVRRRRGRVTRVLHGHLPAGFSVGSSPFDR